MKHLVLLGDSIFDNAAYVAGGPAVIDQVGGKLPAGWRATLLAVDGSMAGDVSAQIKRLPGDATHLALSVGGNDALGVLEQIHSPTAYFSDRGRLFQTDRGRRFSAIVDAQGCAQARS